MQPSARKHASESHAAARPRIALALAGTWFAVGCVALLLVPDLRGSDPWLGWLPFWLVGVPAIEWTLLRLHRREFKASIGSARSRARRAMLVRSTPSRRIRTPAPRAGRARKTSLATALFVRPV
jgi:hypothetical protein